MSRKSRKDLFEGTVKRHPDGFGFFISTRGEIEDTYISKEDMLGVFSHDQVVISLMGRKNMGKNRGKIEKITKRAVSQVVGRLHYDDEEFYLKDSSHSWGMDLVVENPVEAETGQLVVAEITSYPNSRGQNFKGRVKSVIGSQNDPNTDNMRILYESSVPVEFSQKALKEARSHGAYVKEEDKLSEGRKDLRSTQLITIDGVTAKDFDDAICVEETSKGYKLFVAIADVSHYVKRGSTLDSEAYEKGTSVYLSNYVCPMLPEELSNGLCSLNPQVDRLALTCEMHLDFEGEVLSYQFYESVISSHARVTYGEAQEVLDGNTPEKLKEVASVIKNAEKLALVLNRKRKKEGSIDLDIPAIKVLVNDAGEPVDLVLEERIFSNRLIEELMLITNICAAKFLAQKNIAQLYRIHEQPDKEKLSSLSVILRSFMDFKKKTLKNSQDFQEISEKIGSIENKELKDLAQGFVLRSMKQAQYSSENCGHFGLGFSHYSHFTSPIRRYPDLVIHRQIKSAVRKGYDPYSPEDLMDMGAILSAAEQRAVKAERKVTSIKKTRYMEQFLGEEFDGYVSSLTKFGVFVSLKEHPVDGLVKLDELYPDQYIYDEDTWTLRGKRTGLTVRIGDKVRIQIANVNVEEGKIDFSLVELKANHQMKVNGKDRMFADKLDQMLPTKSSPKRRTKDTKKKPIKKRGKVSFSSSSSSRGISFGKKKGDKKKRRRR